MTQFTVLALLCIFVCMCVVVVVVVAQSLGRVRLFVIPWTAACQTSLSTTISQSLLKLMSIESVYTYIQTHTHMYSLYPFIYQISLNHISIFSDSSLSFLKTTVLNYLRRKLHICITLWSVIGKLLYPSGGFMFP